MSNKVKYGLKNVYYSVISESGGVVSYGSPNHVPGAVNLVLNAAGEKVLFSADDTEGYYEEDTNNGYEGSLEMALIPDTYRVDVFGDEIDSNGALIENANAKQKRVALMFEFSGDSKKMRHVLYSCLTSRPNLEGATKTNTKDIKTESMNLSVKPAIDTSNVKAKLKEGDTGYDTFFSAVYLKNAVTNTPDATSYDFSKGIPADVLIDVTSTGSPTVTNVLFDGAYLGSVNMSVSGTDVTIDEIFLGGLANAIYPVTIQYSSGNAVDVLVEVGV